VYTQQTSGICAGYQLGQFVVPIESIFQYFQSTLILGQFDMPGISRVRFNKTNEIIEAMAH
jgi:hypothetical protein